MTENTTLISLVRAGPLVFSAVKVEEDGKRPNIKFEMVRGDKLLAQMGEESARFFISQVQEAFALVHEDEWTRCPTYAAVEADRRAVAARRQSNDEVAQLKGWPDYVA